MPRRKAKEKIGKYIGVRIRAVDNLDQKKPKIFCCRLQRDKYLKKSIRDVINTIRSEEPDAYNKELLERILEQKPDTGIIKALTTADDRKVELSDTVEQHIEYTTIGDVKVGYLDLGVSIYYTD